MTTSWAHMVRGQVLQSFNANSGGALLAIIAAATGPWSLVSAALGRWLVKPPDEKVVLVMAVTVMVVTLIDWGIRLAT